MNIFKRCGIAFLGTIALCSLNFISVKAVNVEYDSELTESYSNVYQGITMPFCFCREMAAWILNYPVIMTAVMPGSDW